MLKVKVPIIFLGTVGFSPLREGCYVKARMMVALVYSVFTNLSLYRKFLFHKDLVLLNGPLNPPLRDLLSPCNNLWCIITCRTALQ